MDDDTFIGNCDATSLLMWLTSGADYHAGTLGDFGRAVAIVGDDDDHDDAIVDLMVLGNNGPRGAIFSTIFSSDAVSIRVTSDYGQLDITTSLY